MTPAIRHSLMRALLCRKVGVYSLHSTRLDLRTDVHHCSACCLLHAAVCSVKQKHAKQAASPTVCTLAQQCDVLSCARLQAANELLKRQLAALRADSGRAALLADQLQATQVCWTPTVSRQQRAWPSHGAFQT